MTVISPEQHGAKAHSDGGWDSNEPGYVPVQTRDARFTSFEHDDFAAVKGYENDWKLTPVARVRPLIDEALDGSPYAYLVNEAAGASVEVQPAESRWVAVRLQLPYGTVAPGSHPVHFDVQAADGSAHVSEKAIFLVPR